MAAQSPFSGTLLALAHSPLREVARSAESLADKGKDLSSDAAADALNVLSVFGIAGMGAVIGVAVALVVVGLITLVGKRHPYVRIWKKRVVKPIFFTAVLFSAHLSLRYQVLETKQTYQGWLEPVDQGFVVLSILAFTWFFAQCAAALEDMTNAHYAGQMNNRGQRLTTQAQILRRTLQAVIIFVGVAAAVLTFPAARIAMSSILASAGLASLIFGFAAQNTLGNMFAGLQLAFTDAFRVGDTVNVTGVDGASLLGVVEEITLTYVVLRRWDERRLIIPSQWFTKQQFENWTRSETNMLGEVCLTLDYKAPVAQIRSEVTRLLNNTDLWDGRDCSVQVTEMNKDTITVRIVVSGADPGNLWDVRCYLREQLIEYIITNAEYCLPRVRLQREELVEVDQDRSPNEVAQLAEELVQIQMGEAAAPGSQPVATAAALPEKPKAKSQTKQQAAPAADTAAALGAIRPDAEKKRERAEHEARLRAAKVRARSARVKRQQADKERYLQAQEARKNGGKIAEPKPGRNALPTKGKINLQRKSLLERQRELALDVATDQPDPSDDSTRFLYSGSQSAIRRGQMFQGPGKEANAERERERQRQRGELDAEAAIDQTSVMPKQGSAAADSSAPGKEKNPAPGKEKNPEPTKDTKDAKE